MIRGQQTRAAKVSRFRVEERFTHEGLPAASCGSLSMHPAGPPPGRHERMCDNAAPPAGSQGSRVHPKHFPARSTTKRMMISQSP